MPLDTYSRVRSGPEKPGKSWNLTETFSRTENQSEVWKSIFLTTQKMFTYEQHLLFVSVLGTYFCLSFICGFVDFGVWKQGSIFTVIRSSWSSVMTRKSWGRQNH